MGQVGETAELSKEETKLLLKGTPRDQIPPATLEKLKRIGSTDWFNRLL
jgi:hypothetical protein